MEARLLASDGLTPRQGREWVARVGRLELGTVVRVSYAVWCARRDAGIPAPDPARVRSAYRMLQRIAFRDPVELADLAVDGEDLRRAGIAAGPGLGKILRALLDSVLEDPRRNTRDQLLAAALELRRNDTDPRTDTN